MLIEHGSESKNLKGRTLRPLRCLQNRLKKWVLPVAENKPCSSVMGPCWYNDPCTPSKFSDCSVHLPCGVFTRVTLKMDQCPKQQEGILVVLLRLGSIPSDITNEHLKLPQELCSVASRLTTHTCPSSGPTTPRTSNKTNDRLWSFPVPHPKNPVVLSSHPALPWQAVQPFYWS